MPDPSSVGATQPPSVPPAGWFRDPVSPAQLRWWDGGEWTAHTMPDPYTVAPATAAPDPWLPTARPVDSLPLRDRRRGHSSPAVVAAVPLPLIAVSQAAVPFGGTLRDHGAPYVPYSQQYSPMKMLTPVRTAGSPNTPAIWLLALVPLLLVPLQVVGFYAGVTTTNVGALTFGLGVIALVIALVIVDVASLRRRNLAAASPFWVLLLPPLAYFIARRLALKKAGVTSNAPGNVYVVSWLAAPVALYLVVLPLEGMRLTLGL